MKKVWLWFKKILNKEIKSLGFLSIKKDFKYFNEILYKNLHSPLLHQFNNETRSVYNGFFEIETDEHLILEFDVYDRYGECYISRIMVNYFKPRYEMCSIREGVNLTADYGSIILDRETNDSYIQMQTPHGNQWVRTI